MQKNPQANAYPGSDHRQQHIFPVHIGGNLLVKKAEHLQGGKLPPTLIDVDVVQIVEDNKSIGGAKNKIFRISRKYTDVDRQKSTF